MRHFILTVAVASASGIAALWPAAASAQLVFAHRQTVQSEVHDLYAPNGPVVDRHMRTVGSPRSITSERWRAGTSDFRQGGLAHSRASWNNGTLIAGTSALARSDAGHNGFAQSSLNIGFRINVWLYGPDDALANSLWAQMMELSGCRSTAGCVFDVSFLHQTRGRFAYANASGDREARFRESLTLRSETAAGVTERRVAGDVGLRLRNNQSDAQITLGGDWSASDMTPFGPTAASQLGLFPSGDVRNALDDPLGDLRGWNFSHSQVLTVPIRFSLGIGSLGVSGMLGGIDVELDQAATAGMAPIGVAPFVFSRSTLSADFADTSTFSYASISDPQGVVDFSQTRVALVAAVVPEPNAAWMALGGLAWLWARRG